MDELFYFTFDLFTKFLRMQKFTLKPFVMFHFGFLLNPLLLDVSGSRRSRCDSSAVAESCVFKPAHPPGKGGDDGHLVVGAYLATPAEWKKSELSEPCLNSHMLRFAHTILDDFCR